MGRTRQKADSVEWALCSAIDKLNECDQFERDVLPLLRRAISERWTNTRMRKEMAALHQALVIHAALGGDMGALQDILDRYEGKPCRRVNKTIEPKMSRAELVELAYQKLQQAG